MQITLAEKMETNEPITNTGTWQQWLGRESVVKGMS